MSRTEDLLRPQRPRRIDRGGTPRRNQPGSARSRQQSRLAVVPGYSHYNFLSSPEVPQIVGKFLADPLTNPVQGAAAASQATSAQEKKQ